MIPQWNEIAMQIAIMHEKYPKLTVSDIAASLMLSPIFIINAMEVGEDMGILKRIKDKNGKLTDKLAKKPKINYEYLDDTALGAENYRLQTELLQVIMYANKDEDDLEENTLNYWTRGIKPSEVELAMHILLEKGIVCKYEIEDPKDKKSKYTFYTLKSNEGKRWGIKQFKEKE